MIKIKSYHFTIKCLGILLILISAQLPSINNYIDDHFSRFLEHTHNVENNFNPFISESYSRGLLDDSDNALKIQCINDDFIDTSKINYYQNVILDSKLKEVRLQLSNNILSNIFGGSNDDIGYSIMEVIDNGYILIGYTESFGSGKRNVWLIKTDNQGIIQWNKTYGGIKNDIGYSLIRTLDEGYLLICGTEPYDGAEKDLWLIKIDSFGNIQWNRTFVNGSWYFRNSVQQTLDGGYIIIGTTNSNYLYSDIWMIKINSTGELEWNKTFGDKSYNDIGKAIIKTIDDKYIILGSKSISYLDTTESRIWVIKTDQDGFMEWNITIDDPEDISIIERSIIQTSDKGFVIIGDIEYNLDERSDIRLVKIDKHGNLQWNKTFNKSRYDSGWLIKQTFDSGYIIFAYAKSFKNNKYIENSWLIKLNSSFVMEWNKTFGGENIDYSYSIQQVSDGGYILTGKTRLNRTDDYDIIITKTDKFGNFNSNGKLISKNLLKEVPNNIDLKLFKYITSIPLGTDIKIQFSPDNINWYNSTGSINNWDYLTNGTNLIDLSFLSWTKPNFYYRAEFSSSNKNIPKLHYINLSYIENIDFDSDNIPDIEDLDDDNDNMPDSWEIQYNLNPLNASDADLDNDNDNFTNKEEYDNNTDPNIPDVPKMKENNNTTRIDYLVIFIVIVIIILLLIIINFYVNIKRK